jgi:hypothetical protein
MSPEADAPKEEARKRPRGSRTLALQRAGDQLASLGPTVPAALQ